MNFGITLPQFSLAYLLPFIIALFTVISKLDQIQLVRIDYTSTL